VFQEVGDLDGSCRAVTYRRCAVDVQLYGSALFTGRITINTRYGGRFRPG
jgi:hypothetical protein